MGIRCYSLYDTTRTYLVNFDESKTIFTSAPLLLFLKLSFAPCFSKSVLPRKVPKPNPAFEPVSFDFDFMYGSPKKLKISSGNPGPSSLIIIVTVSYTHLTLPTT